MLKKLFVHEWKDSWKLVTLFNCIVLVFTIIGAVAMSNRNWSKAMENNAGYSIIFFSYFMLFYFAILALGIASNFYFFIRFYRQFYTDQGYLMHTLPVTSTQLILSKGIVMYIWQLISSVVMMVSILVLVNSISIGFEGTGIFSEIWKAILEIDFSGIGALDVLSFIVSLILVLGLQIFSILFGYLAISLGQLSKNHKLLASIGIYIGMQTVLQMLISCVQVGITVGTANMKFENISEGLGFAILLLITIIFYAIDGGMYAGSNHIMKNKLNLE